MPQELKSPNRKNLAMNIEEVRRAVDVGKLLRSALDPDEVAELLGRARVKGGSNGDRFQSHLSPSALTEGNFPLE